MRARLIPTAILLASAWSAQPAAGEAEPLRYLVAMDFASPFDKGKLGRQVGRMFRMKSTRRALFSVDTEIDWEDRAALLERPALDADPATVAAQAKKAFGCDVLVWGAIERPEDPGPKIVKQHKGYKTTQRSDKGLRLLLHVRALELDAPKTFAVDRSYECATPYELTRKVDEVLKQLTGMPTPADREAAHVKHRMAPTGPNLCAHGDFDVWPAAAARAAAPWTLLPDWDWPMKEGIRLARQGTDACLQYDIPKPVAASTGLFCYSPYIPIDPETYYQVSFRLKTDGPKVILFVKAYRDLEVEGYEGVQTHRQEVFKHQKRFHGKAGAWTTLTTEPFLPRSVKPEHMPQFLRVQLYAYWPPGRVAFDDVVVRACAEREAPAAATPTSEADGDAPAPADPASAAEVAADE